MIDSLITRPAPEEVDSASAAEHPGPAPVAPPRATTGREDYDQAVKLDRFLPGERVFEVRSRDPGYAAAVRAYAAEIYKRNGPPEMVESALREADLGETFAPKRLPNSDHLTDAAKKQLRYQLSQRLRFVGPDSVLLGVHPDPASPVAALVAALTKARGFVESDLKATLNSCCLLDPETHEPRRETLDADEAAYVATFDLVLQEIDGALAMAGAR